MLEVNHVKTTRYCSYKQENVDVINTVFDSNILEYTCQDRYVCDAYDCKCIGYNLGFGKITLYSFLQIIRNQIRFNKLFL